MSLESCAKILAVKIFGLGLYWQKENYIYTTDYGCEDALKHIRLVWLTPHHFTHKIYFLLQILRLHCLNDFQSCIC